MAHVTDNEEDGDYRTLNRDNKQTRSNKKLKPTYINNQNKMLKVVQEDDAASGQGSAGSASHIYLPKGNFMSIVSSPQYNGINSPHGGKMSSRERNAKIMMNQ